MQPTKKQPHKKQRVRGSCFIPLLIIVFVVAIALKIVGLFQDEPQVPLLTPADGLVQLTSADSIAEHTSTPATLPGNTFESSVFVVGVYKEETPNLKEGSVVVVLVRDGWRFADIAYQPDTTLEKEIDPYPTAIVEEIKINSTLAKLVSLRTGDIDCSPPSSDTFPGICKLRSIIIFEVGDVMISIASDGYHATDGELVEMARSILQSVDSEIK